jgi:SAM-dependent methyltransferase
MHNLISALQAQRCAWCGRALDAHVSSGIGRRLCECGTATTSPWPSDAELEVAYERHYRPPGGRFLGPGDRLLRHTRGRLAKRLNEIAPPGPVLDVGAGDGSLLDALHREGREGTGLERHSDRPDVLDVDIEQAGWGWAAIVMWHSLEHLRAPAVALTYAAQALRTDGILVLALPNTASLQARIFGDRWLALDLPRHLTHLPARLVLAHLNMLGLSIERVSHWRGGQVFFGWLHGLVGLLPSHPNLYDAIRRPGARAQELGRFRLVGLYVAALVLAPFALAGAAGEVVSRHGGTIYIEARRVG